MKTTNNNNIVPRPSITLLMRALFASPRTKCSIANTICLLAIALATICAVVLFSSCSTSKQTATDSHITDTQTIYHNIAHMNLSVHTRTTLIQL